MRFVISVLVNDGSVVEIVSTLVDINDGTAVAASADAVAIISDALATDALFNA